MNDGLDMVDHDQQTILNMTDVDAPKSHILNVYKPWDFIS